MLEMASLRVGVKLQVVQFTPLHSDIGCNFVIQIVHILNLVEMLGVAEARSLMGLTGAGSSVKELAT